MEQQSVSEILPGLYRAVLDAVADLEARGFRREAAQIRTDATFVYSRAWTRQAAHRLRALRARAERVTERRPRGGRPVALRALDRSIDLDRTIA